ncbi:membrane associated RING finger, putative [Anopheles sinensis]|uniref:Membrane associated RING finger, putative n=1 Tax=Anopheles sinensis TaxID=74873 RepID=A0A084VLC9_ANOSI|nr:membrane associated RING finger, putative [Anopheles sinensis]
MTSENCRHPRSVESTNQSNPEPDRATGNDDDNNDGDDALTHFNLNLSGHAFSPRYGVAINHFKPNSPPWLTSRYRASETEPVRAGPSGCRPVRDASKD